MALNFNDFKVLKYQEFVVSVFNKIFLIDYIIFFVFEFFLHSIYNMDCTKTPIKKIKQ